MIKKITSKKTQFPVIKTTLILFISISILLTFMIDLSSNTFELNDQKLNTQIIIKKIFTQNCFSNQYNKIELDKFNQEQISSCFKTNNKKILGKLQFENKNINPIYIGNKEEFQFKSQLCNSKSSILCTKLIFPTIIEENNEIKTAKLITYIITY